MKALFLTLMQAAVVALAVADEDTSLDLARKLTNPFADIINVPINQNPDFGIGDGDRWRYTLTVQPVVPIHLNHDWNIISRTVIPTIYEDSGGRSDFGLGDTAQSFFLSPTYPTDEGWFWGAGPIFLVPTATVGRFGADQWGIGPTVGLLKLSGPWTVGALMNHTWSFAGGDAVNATFLQPFIDYTTKSKTTFSLNTESTFDWTRRQRTVPLHFVARQLFEFGDRRVSVALGARYYADAPDGGPEWGLRLGVTFVFPK